MVKHSNILHIMLLSIIFYYNSQTSLNLNLKPFYRNFKFKFDHCTDNTVPTFENKLITGLVDFLLSKFI